MKRLLCILLALTMFLLPGCGETPRIKVSKLGDVRTDVYDVEWRMRIAGWSDLWYAYCAGVPYTITLPDSEAELAYDANILTLTDENGTQTYQYLLSCPRQDKKGYTECLILSDDPEMTPEKCKTPEDGRIILQETMTFRLSPDQGEIPAFITSLESYGDVTFGKEVFYQLQEQDDSFTVNRYDYRGKLISKTEGLSCRGRILELEDGSFLYACDDYPSEYYALECYDQKGAHRWTYRFAEGRKPYVIDLQEHDGKLYCFSNARAPEGCDDWYLYMLSGEGECLQKSRFGGSDFDWIDHVAKTEEGFTVYGTTYSRDGDFPFSSDGYGQDFVAGIDFALQLQNAQKADDSTLRISRTQRCCRCWSISGSD